MSAAPVALISGGSRGLGMVLAERLLGEGWRVATFSRGASEFTDAMAEKHPEDFHWAAVDLADTAALRAFAAAARRRFGRIDLLVNNAGVLTDQELFLTVPGKRIEDLISRNLTAPIALTQACAKVMSAQQSGQIVNISSINAVRGFRGVAVYAAAKAGLDGFTRSLARELGPLHIRVNSVVPGFFDSGMTAAVTAENRERIQKRTPLGRLADVEEIANAVLLVVSPGASFITGQTIIVDGGITC
ncbi:SDR family NAD(P)-dependent oxidoreductase [Glycomyces sp. NPDC048151]|uniref:SDR family NAD(P)-dependent oxidoreductase n=1 Tax=Glycomyces sp. NPDC048151 TaxID=3364002 RepID=UPI00371327AF